MVVKTGRRRVGAIPYWHGLMAFRENSRLFHVLIAASLLLWKFIVRILFGDFLFMKLSPLSCAVGSCTRVLLS
jgi:hypothetical protein